MLQPDAAALTKTPPPHLRMPTLKAILLMGASHRPLRHGGVPRIAQHPWPQ